jgi:hypothetical protein
MGCLVFIVLVLVLSHFIGWLWAIVGAAFILALFRNA